MNDQNLRTPTTKEARERGKAGGIASGKARRKRKTIAEALRLLLDEPASAGSDKTRLDVIVQKCLQKVHDDPEIRDLKTLQELLGEAIIKAEVDVANLQVLVKDKDSKKDIDNLTDF